MKYRAMMARVVAISAPMKPHIRKKWPQRREPEVSHLAKRLWMPTSIAAGMTLAMNEPERFWFLPISFQKRRPLMNDASSTKPVTGKNTA